MPGPERLDPAYLLVPEWDYTLGPAVGELCASIGFGPDPEQQLILDAVFGERDGLPAAREGLLVGPRQNFKSAVLEMIAIGWLFVTCEPGFVWSAHQHKTVRASFDHLVMLINRAPALRRHLAKEPIRSPGDEAIIVTDSDGTERFGMFATRSGRGYRGTSFGKMLLDEYLFTQASHEGALFPTQTTFRDWQRLGATSAGLAESGRARVLRDRGRPGDRVAEPRFLYFETCDDLPGECQMGVDCTHVYGIAGCRYDDPRRWERANFGVARERITLDYIKGERRSLAPGEFGRERLGYWDEPAADSLPVFAEEVWTSKELLDAKSKIVGEPWFALQVSPSQDWAAIMVAGRAESGRIHVETTSQRRGDLRVYNRRASTDWVVPWFRARLEKRGSKPARYESMRLVVLAGSAAASLLPALERIENLDIAVLPESQMPAACGLLLGAVARQELVHVGDPELTASMTAVGRRMVGEKAFVWSPRSSSGDITAAQGATLAVWQVEQEADDYDPLDSIG